MIDSKRKSLYNKRYYEKHKETVLGYMKAKIKCECGATIARTYKSVHLKTKKHQTLMHKK